MTAPITSGSPAIQQFSPQVLTNLKTAAEGLEAAYVTADPAKIAEAASAMSKALESAKQGGMEMQVPGTTSPGDAAKAAQTMASFPQEQLQADIFSMMKLFQGMEREERTGARMDREVNLQAKVTQLNSQADEMSKAADKRFESAMVAGAMQIVGGAMTVGMAGYGASKQVSGLRSEATGNQTLGFASDKGMGTRQSEVMLGNSQILAGKTQTAQGVALGQQGQGVGQMVSGAGSMGAASLTRDADRADEAAKRNETNAAVADTGMQAANDRMQRAKEIIDDMMSKISDMERSNIETNKGIARNV